MRPLPYPPHHQPLATLRVLPTRWERIRAGLVLGTMVTAASIVLAAVLIGAAVGLILIVSNTLA